MTHRVLKAVKESGAPVGVVDVCRLDAFDIPLMEKLLGEAQCVVSVEEHYIHGGLGTMLEESLAGRNVRVHKLGVRDVTPGLYGSRDWLLERHGLDLPGLTALLWEYTHLPN